MSVIGMLYFLEKRFMSAIDSHAGQVEGLSSPCDNAATITPNNDTDLAYITRAIWVGGAGAINVTLAGGQTVLFSGILAGTLLPLRITRVLSSSTSATNLVGIW